MQKFWCVAIAAGLMVGCTPGPIGFAKQETGVSSASRMLKGVVTAPAHLLSNNGGNVVSNGGGNVVSNGGGNLVSNNGGGLTAKRRISYALASLTPPKPVPNATVLLVDATGKPLKDPQGRPYQTKTDAKGQYGFSSAIPEGPVVVEVELPEERGALRALKQGGATTDVDLTSSLTSTYILEQYVKPQGDPGAALKKLPDSQEAKTRRLANEALNAVDVPMPETLTATDVRDTVERLRTKDKNFDGQMTVVEKLLVAAGQLNFGNERPAADVSLNQVRKLVPTPEGDMLIACATDRRIWKVGKDGIIRTVVGAGRPSAGSMNDISGPQAGFDDITWFGRTSQGDLLILETARADVTQSAFRHRITRLRADGRLEEVGRTQHAVHLLYPGDGTAIKVVMSDGAGVAERWRFEAGSSPVREATYAEEGSSQLKTAVDFAWDARGRITFRKAYAALYGVIPQVFRLDPGSDQVEVLWSRGVPKLNDSPAFINWDGGVLFADSYLTATGEETEVPGREPAAELPPDAVEVPAVLSPTAIAIDGHRNLYLTVNNSSLAIISVHGDTSGERYGLERVHDIVYKVAGDRMARLAGTHEVKAGSAQALSFGAPAGVAAGAADTLWVVDQAKGTVVKVGPDGQATRWGPEKVAYADPTVVRMGPDSTAYMLSTNLFWQRIIAMPSGAAPTTWFDKVEQGLVLPNKLTDFVMQPNGKAYIAGYDLYEFDPATRALTTLADLGGFASLALAPDGTLYALSNAEGGKLMKWTPEKKLVTVKLSEQLKELHNNPATMAVDATGRLYVALTTRDKIVRYDPARDELKTIAGSTGHIFNGLTVDLSLDGPAYPAFDAAGNLYFSDIRHRQVKRIPADHLR